jgi:hypothetical protein
METFLFRRNFELAKINNELECDRNNGLGSGAQQRDMQLTREKDRQGETETMRE